MNRVDFLFVISMLWFVVLFGAAAWLLLSSY
jgi:hypothetical protein